MGGTGAADHASDIHRTGIWTASHPICPRIRTPGYQLRAELRPPGNPVRPRVWPASDTGLAAVWKPTSGGDHLCPGECPVHTTGNPIPAYHRTIRRKLGIREFV